MPNAPRRHTPAHMAGRNPQQEKRLQQRQYDRRRGNASSRGYTAAWNRYSAQLCRERVFCELCLTIGIETSIVRADGPNETGERRKAVSVVDHTLPIADGQSDPLFWEPENHKCLCFACDRWKGAAFDQSFGNATTPAERTIDGVRKRWAEVVAKFRQERTGGAG